MALESHSPVCGWLTVLRQQRPARSVVCVRSAGLPSRGKLAAAGLLSPLQWEIGGRTVKRDLAWGRAGAAAPLGSPGQCLFGVVGVDVAVSVVR